MTGSLMPYYFQLGSYDIFISLGRAFFPDGDDKPPRLKDESNQASILNSLAVAYDNTGQSRKAVRLRKGTMKINKKRKDNYRYTIDLGNLALSQVLLGELKQAESNVRRRVDISQEIQDKFSEAIAHQELGGLLAYVGLYDESDNELDQAIDIYAKEHHEQGQCLGWSYRAHRALLMDKPESALKALKKARQFWELEAKHYAPVERDLVHILWLSGWAKRQLSDLAGAETDLNKALSRCRRIRLVESEADIILEIARLHWQKADGKDTELIEQAKSLTCEALDIANRYEYRLKQADIHNFLAEMDLAENDKAAALRHAETARERALCDGPQLCYKKALDEAEQMLANLHGR